MIDECCGTLFVKKKHDVFGSNYVSERLRKNVDQNGRFYSTPSKCRPAGVRCTCISFNEIQESKFTANCYINMIDGSCGTSFIIIKRALSSLGGEHGEDIHDRS